MTKFVEEGGYKELLPITTECRGENTVSRYALTRVNDEVPVGRRPLIPPTFRDVAQPGSASALGAEGPRFESWYPDKILLT